MKKILVYTSSLVDEGISSLETSFGTPLALSRGDCWFIESAVILRIPSQRCWYIGQYLTPYPYQSTQYRASAAHIPKAKFSPSFQSLAAILMGSP